MSNGHVVSFLKHNPTADRVQLVSRAAPHSPDTIFSRKHKVVDIAQGLEYLHGHNPRIVHGDLKGVR